MEKPLLAAIEGGGTKFLCALGRTDAVATSAEIPTRGPAETLAQIEAFFASAIAEHGQPAALGVATFGPIGLDHACEDYGRYGVTPKPGWEGFDLLGALAGFLPCRAAIGTDVNAAALAEASLGAARGCDPVVYVTVGTGVGVGVIVDGKPVHGLGHPEGGHIFPRHHPAHGRFGGVCAIHGDCLEGLASGPAIAAHWGVPAADLPAGHPAWDVEADYLGQLCANLILMLSPQRIVLGGGVMTQSHLYPPIRAYTLRWLGGYISRLVDDPSMIERLITPSGCTRPGLTGAFLLAERLLPIT